MPNTTRIPTSPDSPGSKNDSKSEGWTLETAIDHILALVTEKHERAVQLVYSNDRRYEERAEASQKALEVAFNAQQANVQNAFAAQRAAVDAAFDAQKDAINAALASADRAVTKAELATEKRFESVNEFRGTLDQQQRTLIPRSEVDVLVRGLEEKLVNHTKQIDELRAKEREASSESKGIQGGWGYAVGALGLVLMILSALSAVATFFAGRVQ